MRQNIAKLVKSTGVIPATKASSAFFGARKAQEDSYESKFKKDSASKLTPTKVEEKPGIGSMLLGLVGEFFSGGLVSIMLKTLTLVGIGAFVKAMFTDPEFAKSIKEGFQLILQGTGLAEVWEKVKTGALVVVGAIAGLYIAFNALTGVIFGLAARWAMAGGISAPNMPNKGVSVTKGGGGWRGAVKGGGGWRGAVLSAGAGLLGYNLLSNQENTTNNTSGNISGNTPGNTQPPKTEMSLRSKIGATAAAGSLAYSGYQTVKNFGPGIKDAWNSTAGAGNKPGFLMTAEEKIAQKKAPKGGWAKFMQFLSKRAPAFFIRLGEKLLAAGALATIPFAGWIGAALNLAIAGYESATSVVSSLKSATETFGATWISNE